MCPCPILTASVSGGRRVGPESADAHVQGCLCLSQGPAAHVIDLPEAAGPYPRLHPPFQGILRYQRGAVAGTAVADGAISGRRYDDDDARRIAGGRRVGSGLERVQRPGHVADGAVTSQQLEPGRRDGGGGAADQRAAGRLFRARVYRRVLP
eukprot:630257-Rhodomonas_salina.1